MTSDDLWTTSLIRCGALGMAYPCYAWYHRATTSAGFRHDAVPMPSTCPTYYWLNHDLAEALRIPLREPTFLSNPRFAREILRSRAILDIAGGAGGRRASSRTSTSTSTGTSSSISSSISSKADGDGGNEGHAGARDGAHGQGGGASDDGDNGQLRLVSPCELCEYGQFTPSVHTLRLVSPSRTTPAQLAHLLTRAEGAQILYIRDITPLVLEGAARIPPLTVDDRRVAPNPGLGGGVHELTQLTAGFWFADCL